MSVTADGDWAEHLRRSVNGRLTPINRVVASSSSPLDAWEALAARDLIPPDWLTSSARSFAPHSLCGRCREGESLAWPSNPRYLVRCKRCDDAIDGAQGLSSPERFEDIIAMALQPQRALAAESLAREAATRIPELSLGGQRILWRFSDETRVSRLLYSNWRGSVPWQRREREFTADELDCLARELCEPLFDDRYRHRNGAYPVPLLGLPEIGRQHAFASWVWQRTQGASRRTHALLSTEGVAEDGLDALLASYSNEAEELRRLTLSDNPFEPLVALWGLGFGLQAITEHTIVLVAPTQPR